MNNFKYPIDTLEISHSTMDSYHSCERKLEFSKFYGINMRKPNLAGDAGSAMHEAFGEYLLTKSKNAAILKLMKEYPITLCQNPLWDWSLEACYSALLSLINWSDKNTHIELAKIGENPAIEVPFLINIKHKIDDFLPVVYRGYIDFVFYNRLENSYFVLDLKNTSRKMNDFTVAFKNSEQCLPYSLVLNRALNKDFSSLNVQYLIVKVNIIDPTIQLLDFNKTSEDVEDWGRALFMDLLAIKTFYETKWFPRRNACSAYNRACRFWDICVSRKPETIKIMLKSLDQGEPKEFIPWITLDLEI